MEIAKLDPDNTASVVELALKILQKGGLVIYPTETCYGIGADATNQNAINKLLQFKTRREGKAFSVAVADQVMAEKYVELNFTAQNLYKNFLPGPLTVVSKIKIANGDQEQIAKGVASEFNTIGIRIPDYQFVLNLVKKFDKPITATSANVSYQSSPYSISQWQKQTPSKSQELIDLWVDAGQLAHRNPSTVIDTTVDELTVIRQGSLRFETKLEAFTNSEVETQNFADKLIKNFELEIMSHGLVIGLQGELGAGKTQFAKGVAKALSITGPVRSPTFTLANEYLVPSKNNTQPETKYFYHIDTWRIESTNEFIKIDFEHMLRPQNIVVIEWAEKFQEIIETVSNYKKVKVLWGSIEVLNNHKRKWNFSDRLT